MAKTVRQKGPHADPAFGGKAVPADPGAGTRIPTHPRNHKREVTYFIVMTVASGVGLAKNLVFAKVLGVDELAYYGIVLLTVQYGLYLGNWGILNGLNYTLPIAYGRGETRPEAAAERALGALVITTAITGVIYLAVIFALEPEDPQTETALALVVVNVAAATVAEFFFLMLRVQRQLIPLAVSILARSVLVLVLGSLAGIVFGFEGVVVAESGALILTIMVVARRWLPPLRPRSPIGSETLALIRIGFPLTVASFAVVAPYTLDRLFVVGALPDQFGQYTFASIVVLAFVTLNGILQQLVTPQLLFEHGAGLGLREVRARMLRITGLLAAGAAIGFVALRGLIELARSGPFAEFGPGLDVMPILYLGAALGVLNIYGVVLTAARRFVLIVMLSALGSVVAIAGGLVLMAGSPSLEDFAWLFVASQATNTVALAVATEILFRKGWPRLDGVSER